MAFLCRSRAGRALEMTISDMFVGRFVLAVMREFNGDSEAVGARKTALFISLTGN